MRPRGHRGIAFLAIVLVAVPTLALAKKNRRPKAVEHVAPATPADKRDRVVSAQGTPFHGKAYWQAAAQCGGIYFQLGTAYSEAAIRAKVTKPDPAAYAKFTRDADGANRTATAFFVAAEHFLIADRKLSRDEAVMTYDGLSASAGDKVKSAEAANQAAKPCPDLYKICRAAHPQMCNDTSALTN